jgi:hypothetical protein
MTFVGTGLVAGLGHSAGVVVALGFSRASSLLQGIGLGDFCVS